MDVERAREPSDASAIGAPNGSGMPVDVDALLPVVRRVVGARLNDPAEAEDAVQETVARVLEASDRIGDGMAESYAITTARNLVSTHWRDAARQRRHLPRFHELDAAPERPEERVAAAEDAQAMDRALAAFRPEDRELLLAHEVRGEALGDIARRTGSTAGALAARLRRLRARLRTEYLIAQIQVEPPAHRCRTVLHALSLRDRRRQRESDAEAHLLECDYCRRISGPLLELYKPRDGEVRKLLRTSGDIVAARRSARAFAAEAGLPRADLTLVAAAVTEVARNAVSFAGEGEFVAELVIEGRQRGVRITLRDAGPGLPELPDAAEAGAGAGLGLTGCQRLMDEFDVVTRPGRGTTVTMAKWCPHDA